MNIDGPVWDHSTFSFNRDRLFDAEIAQGFFENTVLLARLNELTSDEHFSVDGTLLEAWASHKSFRRKDGGDGDGGDFRGEERSNTTHASTTDPDARLMRKGAGKEAKLSYLANALMENRDGLIVGVDVRHATGTAERDGALDLVNRHLLLGATLGADKGYDARAFVEAIQRRGIRAHIARHTTNGRRSAIDGRTARGRWLCDESAGAQAYRTGVRLGQDDRRPAQAASDRPGEGAGVGDVEFRGVQPGPDRRNRGMVESVADLRGRP